MKRFGWFCLIALLVAAALFAFQRDLFPVYFNLFTGRGGGTERLPEIDLEEGSFPASAEKEQPEQPAANVKALARQITAGASSEYEKLCAVYDWVTANIAYDVDKAKNMKDYGSGAKYLLEKRKGVCHDYAELTRVLLKAAGITATYEKGEVRPASGRTERHAWNHARIGEIWYGLDTTWGAGFVDEEKGIFVQRPSRLYLTTPEELARLHSDPSYKEAREKQRQRKAAAEAKSLYLPDHEAGLLRLINDARVSEGLSPFHEEPRLLTAARQSAAAAAEQACRGEEYSLDPLRAELERKAPELRLSRAGMYAFTLWDYPVPAAEELYRLITAEEGARLDDDEFQALTLGVVRRGELTIAVLIFTSFS